MPTPGLSGLTAEALLKIGLALTSALLVTLLVWSTWRDFEGAQQDARDKVSAASAVAKAHAARSLSTINLVLEIATQLVERKDFDKLPPDEQWQQVGIVSHHLPPTGQLFILNQSGDRIAATPIYPGPIINVSDPEWFRQLKESNAETYIGRATRGRSNLDLFFYAARAVRDAEGTFKGAVMAAVEVSYISELFRDLDGPNAEVQLYRADDGAIIARHPMTGEMLDETAAAEPFFAAVKAAKHWTGWVHSHGEDRMLSARRTDDAPVIAAVSIPKGEVYAGAWARTFWRGLAGTIIAGALFGLTGLVVRQARRDQSFRHSLAASEGRFREMADHAPVMVWVTEPDGSCSFLSRSWYKFTGQSPETGLGYGWLGAVHNDDRAKLEESIRVTSERRAAGQAEYRLRRHDGVYQWVLAVAAPRFDRKGGFLGYIGSVIDISERKEAELALAERNAQLALAAEAARVGGYILDVPENRLQISEGFAAIYQLPVGVTEISLDQWRAMVNPNDLKLITDLRTELVARQQSERLLEYRITRRDGRTRWIESRSIVAYDSNGRPLRTVGVNIDLTERKEAELALAERNAQLALAGKAARVGGWILDFAGDRIQVTEGYAAIYQLPVGTKEISVDQWRAIVHPDDIKRLDERRGQSFAERQPERFSEYRIVHRDGSVHWIESRGLVTYGSDGRPLRMVGVSIDITERKQADERQRQLIAELDHRVKNVLAKIVALIGRTADTCSSMDEFKRVMSARLQSMANAHALLSRNRWQGVSLSEIVRQELASYSTDSNTTIEGPDVMLVPEASQAAATVLHELATNAAKYGALSVADGHVRVEWRFEGGTSGPTRLVVRWEENGGPPVAPPSRIGFGTRVIRGTIPHQFDGRVDLTFAPQGVRCVIEVPLSLIEHRES